MYLSKLLRCSSAKGQFRMSQGQGPGLGLFLKKKKWTINNTRLFSETGKGSICRQTSNLLQHQGRVLVGGFPHNSKNRTKPIHTTNRECAAHPLVWVALRNGIKVLTPIFSRAFRFWWFRLPDERRRRYYDFFMKHRSKLIFVGLGGLTAAFVYYLTHLDRAPITNRVRFVTLTNKQFDEISAYESQKVLLMFQGKILPKNDSRVRAVTGVARKILRANSDLPQIGEKDWKVYVVDSEQLDTCFVLPVRKHKPFPQFFIKNADQLAVALGHEMSHAILGHGPENLSWAGFLDWFIIAVMAGIWAVVPLVSIALVTNFFFESVVSILLKLPYSRKLELEADSVGMELAAKVDTLGIIRKLRQHLQDLSKFLSKKRESYAFWTNMAMVKKRSQSAEFPDFLSTHPSHGDRAKRLDVQIPRSLKIREECDCAPLKPYDPRLLADAKARMLEEELALQGRV